VRHGGHLQESLCIVVSYISLITKENCKFMAVLWDDTELPRIMRLFYMDKGQHLRTVTQIP
jgi:hypothetical protein